MIINLQYIPDPLAYLQKQKLRALGLPDGYITNEVYLVTPMGDKYELAKDISNLELVNLIQDLIDETIDALTIWCTQRSLYHSHLEFNPTENGL